MEATLGSWTDARRGGTLRSSHGDDGYKTAAVCVRGHIGTSNLEYKPDLAANFCKECGGQIITACPSCQTPIRGVYTVRGTSRSFGYTPPNYCEDCGQPFPWITEKLKAASALADELENLSDVDRQKIKQSLDEITKDTPNTDLAVIRLKKFLGKATDAIGQALWKATIEIATEAAKKALLG
jgi:hypothetical protein